MEKLLRYFMKQKLAEGKGCNLDDVPEYQIDEHVENMMATLVEDYWDDLWSSPSED